MKKILVPIDFSAPSRKASEYAAWLAKSLDASLLLLHVYLEPAAVGEMPAVWLLTELQLQEDNEAWVNKEVAYLQKKFGVPVQGLVKNGFKNEEISAIASQVKADLIVMGMKGSGKNNMIGSTTLSTMRRTAVPLIVVPENIDFTPIKNITFATDYNERTDLSCFRVLFDIAQRFNSEIRMVHVREKPERMQAAEIAGKLRLEKVMTGLKHDYYTVQDRNVESGIISFVNRYPSDMLAMVSRPHHIFRHLFGTIHTRAMCAQAQLPLLILEDK